MKMQCPIGIHCHVLAFYGEDTVYISTVHRGLENQAVVAEIWT